MTKIRAFTFPLIKGVKWYTWTALAFVVIMAPIAYFTLLSPKEAEAEWYDEGWAYRKKITIDNAQVSGSTNLTDFPIAIIETTDTDLRDNAQADGDDIVFTDSGGKKLDHEIEKYTSANADLYAWVKIPTLLAAEDTIIYMYYGNPSVTSQQNADGVWDSNFTGVYHLNDDFLDSTTNNNNATNNNSTTATGTIADGQEMDASGEYVYAPMNELVHSSVGTIEFWYDETDGATSYEAFFGSDEGNDDFQLQRNNSDTDIAFGVNSVWYSWTPTSVNAFDGNPHHVVLTYDTDSNSTILYLDGSSEGTSSTDFASVDISTYNFRMGNGGDAPGANPIDGTIDEFRVSNNDLRTSDWVATSYNTQNHATSAFYTLGSSEIGPGPVGWWNFDEGVDNTCSGGANDACDGTVNVNDGVFGANAKAPSWQTEDLCIFGKCLYFDGSNDYLDVSDSVSLSPTNAVTLEAWVKFTGAFSADSDEQDFGIIDKDAYKMVFNHQSGELDFEVNDSAATSWTTSYSGSEERIYALAVLDDYLYAGQANDNGDGDVLICDPTAAGDSDKCDNASDWSTAYDGGEERIRSLATYKGKLYAGQGSGSGDGDIFVCDDPSGGGDSDKCDNASDWSTAYDGSEENVFSFAVYKDKLYAGLGSASQGAGDVIVCDPTAAGDADTCDNASDWSTAYDNSSQLILSMAEFNGNLYAGLGDLSDSDGDNIAMCDPTAAGDADTCDNASDWSVVYNNTQEYISAMAVYNGKLYASEGIEAGDGDIVVCTPSTAGDADTCDHASDWTTSYDGSENTFYSLAVYNGKLYAGQGTGSGDGDVLICDPTAAGDSKTCDNASDWSTSHEGETHIYALATYKGKLYAGQGSGANLGDVLVYGNNVTASSTKASWDNNRWYHVAATYNTTADSVDFYINGALDSTTSISTTAIEDGDGQLFIGSTAGSNHAGSSGGYHSGFIDEVKIYPYERTAAQVKADYAGGGAVFGDKTDWLSDGLVGYWKMDDNVSGDQTIVDSSGNGNDGTSEEGGDGGMDCTVTGKFGTSCDFDGQDASGNDYIQVTDDTSIQNIFDNGGTISFWANPDSDGETSTGRVMSKDETWRIYAHGESGGNLRYSLYQDFDNTDGYWGLQTGDAVPINSWSHITITYDNSDDNNDASFYVNGGQVIEYEGQAPDGTRTTDATNNLFIGNNDTSATDTFDGSLEEVRIYNRTLSPAEVADLYEWAPGPELHWKLDEGSGTSTVYDSSGNGYNGTMNAAATDDWVPGKFGQALTFDGTDTNYVNVSDSINQAGSLTWQAWYKTTYDSTEYSAIFTKGTSLDWTFTLNLNNNTQRVNCGMYQQNSGQNYIQANHPDNEVVNDGKWHHTACVYDADSDTLKQYTDGVEVASTTGGTGTRDTSSAGDTYIGHWEYGGSDSDFDGVTDEVRVYDYARTAQQVVEDMNAGHPAPGSPIGSQISHWKFDDMYGDTTPDLVGDNDGNLGGTLATCPDDGQTYCPSWTTSGKINNALDFDGIGDHVGIDGILTDLANSTTGAVSLWAKWDSDSGNEDVIFSISRNADAVGTYLNIEADLSSNDDLEAYAVTDGSTQWKLSTANDFMDQFFGGDYVHILLTHDGTEPTLYVNGKEIAVTFSTSTDKTVWFKGVITDATSDADVASIGTWRSNGGTAIPMNGFVDEVKVYNDNLTASQVLIDMNAGGATNFGAGYVEADDLADTAGNPPVGYWPLDENTGTTTTYDKSGNGNDGTLTSITEDSWVVGKRGSALTFDGSADFVDIGAGPSSVKTVSFWAYPVSTTEYFVDLNGTDYIWANAGTLTASGFTSPTYYVDGISGATTIVANQWQYITVTTDTAENASDFDIGRLEGTDNYEGTIDDVKVYDYARTPAQVAYDYNRGAPVGWWKLDECQGTTAYDYSGNSNDGTITPGDNTGTNDSAGTCSSGASSPADEMWDEGTTGKRNASLDFDGTNDYVEISDTTDSVLDITDAITVAAWIKADAFGWYYRIVDKNWTGQAFMLTDTSPFSGLEVWISSDMRADTGTGVLTAGTWHHVAYTYDKDAGGSDEVKIYIDGVVKATGDYSGAISTNDDSLDIGRDTTALSATYFNGLIDDVRVYNYALSAAQIKKTMLDGSVGGSVRFGPSTGSP